MIEIAIDDQNYYTIDDRRSLKNDRVKRSTIDEIDRRSAIVKIRDRAHHCPYWVPNAECDKVVYMSTMGDTSRYLVGTYYLLIEFTC